MSKNRIYLIVIIALVLSHVVLFSIPLLKGPAKKHPKKVMIHELSLSVDQVASYEVLIDEHRKSIRALKAKIQTERMRSYTALKNEETIAELNVITKVQHKIEQAHFSHFKALRALCDDAQKKKFDALTPRLHKIFFKAPKK
jgi:competence protein ComGC